MSCLKILKIYFCSPSIVVRAYNNYPNSMSLWREDDAPPQTHTHTHYAHTHELYMYTYTHAYIHGHLPPLSTLVSRGRRSIVNHTPLTRVPNLRMGGGGRVVLFFIRFLIKTTQVRILFFCFKQRHKFYLFSFRRQDAFEEEFGVPGGKRRPLFRNKLRAHLKRREELSYSARLSFTALL